MGHRNKINRLKRPIAQRAMGHMGQIANQSTAERTYGNKAVKHCKVYPDGTAIRDTSVDDARKVVHLQKQRKIVEMMPSLQLSEGTAGAL